MTTVIKRGVLLLVGLAFVSVGLSHLLWPHQGVAPFGLVLTTVSSLNEVRANYGGAHLLLGLFMVLGAFRATFQQAGLLFVLLFTGGLVLGRAVSLAVDGSPNSFVWFLFAGETVAFVVSALALMPGKDTKTAAAEQGQ